MIFRVTSVDASHQFYGEKLGIPTEKKHHIEPKFPLYLRVNMNGQIVRFSEDQGEQHGNLRWYVDDIDKVYARVVAADDDVVSPISSPDGKWKVLHLTDPDGNKLLVISKQPDSRSLSKRWSKWSLGNDTYEFMPTSRRRFSLLLFCIATLLWCMRRLSPWEHIKHCLKETRAWGLELYLILVCWLPAILFTLNEADIHATKSPRFGSIEHPFLWIPFSYNVWTAICLWAVAQTIQSNFYHEFWRTLAIPRSDEDADEELGVFSRLRNLILAIFNLCFVSWMFGLVYWLNRQDGVAIDLHTVWDGIYFSFVTGSTLGYGGISPDIDHGFLQGVRSVDRSKKAASICFIQYWRAARRHDKFRPTHGMSWISRHDLPDDEPVKQHPDRCQ